MIVMPFALPIIAAFRMRALRQSMMCLTAASLVMKLAYSYDLNCWTMMEGRERNRSIHLIINGVLC